MSRYGRTEKWNPIEVPHSADRSGPLEPSTNPTLRAQTGDYRMRDAFEDALLRSSGARDPIKNAATITVWPSGHVRIPMSLNAAVMPSSV